MTDMSETPVEQALVEVPAAAESAPTEVSAAPVPEKKKRGRKPKVPTPPPAPVIVAAPKIRKRRTPEVRATKGERAIAAAISAAQVDRVKCIAKCAKVMQLQSAEKGVLESIDWQIAMLTGNSVPSPQSQPGYPIPPQFPQPPAYPNPLAAPYTPPSMRQPALPIEPRANGGAEGIVDDTENDDPDKYLKGGGLVGGGGYV